MTYITRIVIAIVLLTSASTAHAEFISVRFSGSDRFVNPNDISRSRFEGNPTVYERQLGAGTFQGTVFSWLAIMRFDSQADFDANKATASGTVSAVETPFTAIFLDSAGRSAELAFKTVSSGVMNYSNPRLDVSFVNPTGQATLGDAVIDVTLATAQRPFVTPAITFDGGVSIPPPLPIVTDVLATISVYFPPTSGDDGGSQGNPDNPTGEPTGENPGVPEPTALVMLGLGFGLALARHSKRRLMQVF